MTVLCPNAAAGWCPAYYDPQTEQNRRPGAFVFPKGASRDLSATLDSATEPIRFAFVLSKLV
jgi:hypothetical protein